MSDTAHRITNALAERYVLERELGQGGMATVFLAHDVKHDRKVAFKVLRPELAAVIGAERFLQEIKVTANLQHPHILPLHDSGDADGFLFYVMPYVEGESLRDLLDREKQLGIEEAIDITQGIASALDYAHRQGVIHRDIKPENILMHDGQPMVADFGIALAVSQASGARLTETGLSIGTPHYMSPEQAMGDRELDARADVYSLGAMLYEMLAGDPPYTGSTAQAIVAKVITEKAPPVTAARDTVPGHVGAAIGKALAKMPADRFRSAKDFADALSNPSFVVPTIATAAAPAVEAVAAPAPGWKRYAWPAATVAFAVLAVASFLRPSAEPAGGAPSRFMVPANTTGSGRLLAVSPDGSEIVFVGDNDGQQQLMLRRAGDLEIRPIPDTEGGRDPTFSPDGEWVAFAVGSDIKRVRTSGGAALTVARAARGGSGLHWGESDDIVFLAGSRSLGIVPGSGGTPSVIGAADSNAPGLRWPHLLPDGRSALVTEFSSLETASIVAFDLETGATETIVAEGVFPEYVPTGHLVYGHSSGTVFAVRFDAVSREVTGQPTALLEDVQVFSGGAMQFAASRLGTVAYLKGERSSSIPQLVDLGGSSTAIDLPSGDYSGPRFAPDGNRILFMGAENEVEVRIFNRISNTSTLLSTEDGTARYPMWDATGDWVWYARQSEDVQGADIVRRRSDGSGDWELVYSAPGDQWPQDITREGSLVFRDNADATGRDLLQLAPGSDSATVLLANPWDEWGATLSPDERWMAYVSDESQRPEVYLTAFPQPAAKLQVSQNGGTTPVWSPDGRKLYYQASDGNLFVADLDFAGTATVTNRQVLFSAREYTSFFLHADYDVHPDGEPFVFIGGGRGTTTGITVVVNWFAELRELMGEN